MGGMDNVIQEFLAESFENLDRLDQDLVTLERNPEDTSVFARVFRTIHTIKGTCGFLAFQRLENVTHVGETVLSRLRDGELRLTPPITSVLLAMLDAVREMLITIKDTGSDGATDYADLIAQLANLTQDEQAPPPAPAGQAAAPEKKKLNAEVASPTPAAPVTSQPSPDAMVASALATTAPPVVAPPATSPRPARTTKVAKAAKPTMIAPAPASPPPPEPVAAPPPPVAVGPDDGDHGDVASDRRSGQSDRRSQPRQGGEDAAVAAGSDSIRVDVAVFDRLMNLVGELVLARNQILQYAKTASDPSFVAATQRLNGVTGELQEAVMKTRMQPISAVWSKMPRFVRDLAVSCDKQVELEMDGQDTELDKSVIDAIKGSLLHLIRNSVDHGLEDAVERVTAGKPAHGTIRLRAAHEGGCVIIEVADDGRGLDRDRILARAVERGLATVEQSVMMSDREVENLLFTSGFSTAKAVTNISGRGVGLDAVRSSIESIGGSIDLKTEPGQSTTIRMKIPLTLAIIPVLIVSVGRHRFAIPQVAVVELVRLDASRAERGIERLHGVPVYRLRGKLLPLVFLHNVLKVEPAALAASSSTNIVVLHGDNRNFGLVVDSIDDSQEIVVKPLGRLLKGLPYAGATILGDGRVCIILDILRLGLGAGVVTEDRERAVASLQRRTAQAADERTTLLLLEGSDGGRRAIPFTYVSRLEFLPRSRVERVGDVSFIQYRDEILQLVDLEVILPERRSLPRGATDEAAADAMQVVVCSIDGRHVGLVVHRIMDIVEESVKVQRPASRAGVRGCVVIQTRVTEIVDLKTAIALADPSFFERPVDGLAGTAP